STVIDSATDGYKSTCGADRSEVCALLMSPPQETVDGGSPMPRKDSVASSTMNRPREMVATTMTGAMALGRMCRVRIRMSLAPRALAAVTKSDSFTEMTDPRMMRDIWGQPRSMMAATTVQMLRKGKACRKTMAPSRSGMAKNTSTSRDSNESTLPP